MKRPVLIIFLFIAAAIRSAAQDGLWVKQGDKGNYLEHTVSAGQGLYSVGRLYNINPKHIASYNKFDMNQGLEIGQVVRIPLTDTNFNQKSNKGVPVYYIVGPGEGLLKVSTVNNKVKMQSLRDWNGLKSDALQVGQKLIVGYFVFKEMPNVAAIPKTSAPVRSEESAVAKTGTAEEKPKTQPAVTQPTQTIAKEEPEKEEPKKEEPKRAGPPAAPTPVSSQQGYFKTAYEQQTKQSPVSKNTTVTSGIFKTSSGWEDAKYYLLIDGVATGTIVQLVNPDNNKAIYAKVLGEMNGIRQNQGLGVRISNAGAAALGIAEPDKFILKISY